MARQRKPAFFTRYRCYRRGGLARKTADFFEAAGAAPSEPPCTVVAHVPSDWAKSSGGEAYGEWGSLTLEAHSRHLRAGFDLASPASMLLRSQSPAHAHLQELHPAATRAAPPPLTRVVIGRCPQALRPVAAAVSNSPSMQWWSAIAPQAAALPRCALPCRALPRRRPPRAAPRALLPARRAGATRRVRR